MKKAVFLIVYPFLWLISKLPFPIFYLISDILFVIIYHLIGYRKKVVQENLLIAFPQKTEKERNKIEKAFYKHMCDMFLEMIKTLSISKKELKKRFVYKNIEALTKLEKKSKGVIVMCGHYASYEWATAINFYKTNNKGYAIYKKVKNPYFHKLVKDIRANLGTTLISSKEVIPTMMRNIRAQQKSSYYMIADQSPKKGNQKHYINFLGKEVPAFVGSEAMAKRLGFAVLYLQVEKVKRGFYEASFVSLAENAENFADYKITDKFFSNLAQQIKRKPEYYLWTHKRFKHAKN